MAGQRTLDAHARLQNSSAHLLWDLGRQKVSIGLCIAAVLLLQCVSRVKSEGPVTSRTLLESAPHIPAVLLGCQASIVEPIEDPTAACGLLRDLLVSLETREERGLDCPGFFTFHGPPDEATVEIVVGTLQGLLT